MAKGSCDIIGLEDIPPFVNHILNVFINIYEYANQRICICKKEIIGICLSFILVLSLEV